MGIVVMRTRIGDFASAVGFQVTDSAQQTIVSDASFGNEVRILATTLPQFSLAAVAVQLSTQARSGKLLGNLGGLTSTS